VQKNEPHLGQADGKMLQNIRGLKIQHEEK
jgi:hypothetical protein